MSNKQSMKVQSRIKLMKRHFLKPWFTFPKHPNPYKYFKGDYIPTVTEVINEYPNYSINDARVVIDIFTQEIKIPITNQFRSIAESANDINFNSIWQDLDIILPEAPKDKIKFSIYQGINFAIIQSLKITEDIATNSEIEKIIKSALLIGHFLNTKADNLLYLYSPHLLSTSPRYLNLISNYIDEFENTSSLFGFDTDDFPDNDASFFKHLLDEDFPTLSDMLFKLANVLEQTKKLNPTVKQKNSKNVELQAFCRLLVVQLKIITGKPCYKVASKIAAFVFENQTEVDITEDYVKQTCRTKINNKSIGINPLKCK